MGKLKLGFIMFQIMAKHKEHVKNIMLVTCELNKYMFFIEQDVKALFKSYV
jgi:hypothetical protein